jgi:L-ribulose-5-phosphate 3-epimerase
MASARRSLSPQEDIVTHSRVGVLAPLRPDGDSLRETAEFGLRSCQLVSWQPSAWNDALAARVRREAAAGGLVISAFWAGWTGPKVWDFIQGPTTLGIVPPAHRARRVAELRSAGGFAKALGVPAVITHLGFIPENPADPLFGDVVSAVREIALHLKSLGLQFWFETGQETPVTLLRLIHAVGTGNLGLNLDPANLILYGKASPVDALSVFGTHVKNVHAKDGMYPTDPDRLGVEMRIGDGAVQWPALVKKLEGLGYRGPYTIEREVSGEEQKRDIAYAVSYLEGLLAAVPSGPDAPATSPRGGAS